MAYRETRMFRSAVLRVDTEEEAKALFDHFAGSTRLSVRGFCMAVIMIGKFEHNGHAYSSAQIIRTFKKFLKGADRGPEFISPHLYFPSYAGIEQWVVRFKEEYLAQFVLQSRHNILDLVIVSPGSRKAQDYLGQDGASKYVGLHAHLSPGQLCLDAWMEVEDCET